MNSEMGHEGRVVGLGQCKEGFPKKVTWEPRVEQ